MKFKEKIKRLFSLCLATFIFITAVPISGFESKAGRVTNLIATKETENINNGLSKSFEEKYGVHDGSGVFLTGGSYFVYSLTVDGQQSDYALYIVPYYGGAEATYRSEQNAITMFLVKPTVSFGNVMVSSASLHGVITFSDDTQVNDFLENYEHNFEIDLSGTGLSDSPVKASWGFAKTNGQNIGVLHDWFKANVSNVAESKGFKYCFWLSEMISAFGYDDVKMEVVYASETKGNGISEVYKLYDGYKDKDVEVTNKGTRIVFINDPSKEYEVSDIHYSVTVDGNVRDIIVPEFSEKHTKMLIDSWKASIKKDIENSQNEAANNSPNQAKASSIMDDVKNKQTSVQMWMYLINNFFATGEMEVAGIEYTEGGQTKPISLYDYYYAWLDDGDTKDSADSEYKASDYNGYIGSLPAEHPQKNLPTSAYYPKNSVSPVNREEDLRIRTYYTIMRAFYTMTDEAQKNVTDEEWEKLDNIFDINSTCRSEEYNPDEPTKVQDKVADYLFRDHGSVSVIQSAQTEATAASDKFVKGESEKPNLNSTVNNFDNVMRYFWYGMTTPGAEYSENGGGTTNVVKLNPGIDSIVPAFPMDLASSSGQSEDQKVGGEILNYRAVGLPRIPNGKVVGNSYQSHQKYGQIMLALMYLKRWAAVDLNVCADLGAWGGEKNEGTVDEVTDTTLGYDVGATGRYSKLEYTGAEWKPLQQAEKDDFQNKALEEWLLKISTESDPENQKPPQEVASVIRYYTQIYKGLEYIGCASGTEMYDEWVGPEIQKILDYYPKIQPYENKVEAQVNEMQEGNEQSFYNIFNDDDKSFMAHYAEGVAASATYVPLITNLYSPEAWSVISEESFIDEFHYKYGFLRKALYYDTTANAAMNWYVTGAVGKLKPVTLRDFIENDGSDIVLYIDSKMYRMDKVSEKFNLAYSKFQNTEDAGEAPEGFVDSVGHWVANLMDTDAESICKSGSAKVYSQDMANKTDPKGKRSKGWHLFDKNQYIMTDYDIEYFLQGDGSDEDEVQKAFATVSGIYRDKSVYNIAQNEAANPKPVFVSSKSLCNMTNATREEFNTLYNYMMVSNLKHKQGMDYEVDIDMDAPLFMDIYGNICSMSGIVIIPAVSNSTLYNGQNYDAANAGMASLYNDVDSVKVRASWLKNKDMLDSVFVEENGDYVMQSKDIDGMMVVFANLPMSSTYVREVMYEIAYRNAMATGNEGSGIAGSKFNSRVALILEVLRGADIEDIDFQKEGLQGATGVDRTGIYIAYRVEELGNLIMSNSNGNSLLELPNIAFMPGFEYVVVVLFKVLFAIMIVILMVQVYLDGVADRLGVKTIVTFTMTLATIIISIIVLPQVVNTSYYHTNKTLLQNESIYMQMLNLEKRMNGQEIAIRQKTNGQPQTTTKFYLKLEEVKVPWWSIITDVLSSDTFTKMQDIYDTAMGASVYGEFGNGDPDAIIKRGNSMYADVDWLFSTSRVEFAPYQSSGAGKSLSDDETSGYLYQNIPEAPNMSYVVPYYAILDVLLANAMEYNEVNNVAGYTSTPSGNDNEQILTKGLLKPYFTSFDFMQAGSNILGLYEVYGIAPPLDKGTIFTAEEITQMRRSLWCNMEGLTDAKIQANLEQLDLEAKKFIVDNRGMLDKVSDATFIKCMALYLATRHNTLMKVPSCRGLEIYAMDTRDIMRLSLTNKSTVMRGSQKSFEKFCFDEGGTFSIILAAFLEVIYWLTSLIKPLLMIVMLATLVFSYLWKRLVRLEGNHSLEGYLVSVCMLCIVNIVYALTIKLSMWIPTYSSSIVMCLLGQIVMQIGYVLILLGIATTILGNIQDIGFYTYKTKYDTHIGSRMQAAKMQTTNILARTVIGQKFMSGVSRTRQAYGSNTRTKDVTGNTMLSDMREREERRRTNVYNNR